MQNPFAAQVAVFVSSCSSLWNSERLLRNIITRDRGCAVHPLQSNFGSCVIFARSIFSRFDYVKPIGIPGFTCYGTTNVLTLGFSSPTSISFLVYMSLWHASQTMVQPSKDGFVPSQGTPLLFYSAPRSLGSTNQPRMRFNLFQYRPADEAKFRYLAMM